MTGVCGWQPELRGDESSGDDSLSLLHNLDDLQHVGAAAFMKKSDLDSAAGNKNQEKDMELNEPRPADPEICSSTMSAADRAASASKKANVLRSVKLPSGAGLHRRNGLGETLLHRACKKKDLQMVRALIQAGISVNMKDNAGWTALHEAAAKGDEVIVEELLKAGANPNARSFDGVTPLHDAVTSGHHEVVKLLLQFGSHTCDKTVGGLSALDMATDENMKELLLTFRDSLVFHEEPVEESAQHEQPGCKSSEAQCHKQLRSQRNFSPNVRSRESGDGAGAREPADIQPRGKHTDALNTSLEQVLEEVWRKQTELSSWPLSAPQDTDRYGAALTQIQDQLIQLLYKQMKEKDRLALKQRSVSRSLWQRVFKTRLVSLASRQRKLVEILQKQMHLVEVYVTAQPPNHQTDQLKLAPTAQDSQVHREVPQACVLRPAARRPPPTLDHTHSHIIFQIKRKSALIQSRAEKGSRHLSELMQRGVLQPGHALHLFLKRHLHCAHVLADGSLKDLKGRVHPSPKHWLESVLGKNIPVSSAYAWDKGFRAHTVLTVPSLNTETTPKLLLSFHHQHPEICK
ncbi:ankyrin repeat domain-containing protein 31-like isoform X2 [Notolabrus celidotus]|uniref:ankyrin repeat domain-containing protein 31-like isoform X2 n=1 Tax=Notolabrus celidotus TaxID=1203425 RepID=UPI00148F7649|nr:ankyrin repeat domain-containing protein 31-like isoform X2 [Notolabrus celidotus]